MVRCERFIVKHSIKDKTMINGRIMSFLTHPVIYDRVEERKIITVDTGDEDIDAEIIDELMNILNRKYLLKK